MYNVGIQHEMWFISSYIWMVICSKTHVTCIPCCDEKIADDLFQDMACGWQGQDKILACYNPCDTLPDSPRNSGNTDNWDQFLVAMCTFIALPFWSITWAPNHRGEWFCVFPWHQICGVSTNSNQFPKHPLGVQQVHLHLMGINGAIADSVGWGLKNIQFRCQPWDPMSIMLVTK